MPPQQQNSGKVTAIVAAAGSALILYVAGSFALVGLWGYGIYDLFLQHKILEAAIMFFVFPFGVIYGLGRFFSVGGDVMPDIGALAAALSSLNAAKDIAHAMIGLRDSAAFNSKLIEFQSKIIDANNAAFAAQDERASLLEQIRKLEKEMAALKAWETEKQRYQLQEVIAGATAYVLKEEANGTEPIHWLCANCYQDGKKGILQLGNKADSTGRLKFWGCPICKSSIIVRYDVTPGKGPTF